jgi:FMN phosphatase YigB (HAD superfamily)
MKVLIFDLDDVLIHEGFEPPIVVDGVPQMLKNLAGGKLVLASYNAEAARILKDVDLHHYFDHVVAYEDDGSAKRTMLKEIIALYPSASDYILFDDLQPNIDTALRLGMQAKLVNWMTGLCCPDIEGLQEFSEG